MPHRQLSLHAAVLESRRDTIFALSTPPGRAGLAVVRVSGLNAKEALQAMLQTPDGTQRMPTPRRASLRRLFDPTTLEELDQAIVLWMPGPATFTGEDVAELHLHGSHAVVQGVLKALSDMPAHRLAEPGEFTRRAFDNGRMDLTEAEGLADLLEAETEAQRKQALSQMQGVLRRTLEGWRDGLVQALAHTEAVIDFAEDELDVGPQVFGKVSDQVRAIADGMARHLADDNRGEILRSGFSVAILGPPNAGKSSLLNLLARRDAAIVSPVAGTTRDVVEVALNLRGLPVRISDTAGIRATADVVEAEGVVRARQRGREAQLKLCLFDAGGFPGDDDSAMAEVNTETLLVLNKVDLPNAVSDEVVRSAVAGLGVPCPARVWRISCRDGSGVDALVKEVAGRALARLNAPRGAGEEGAVITRTRHRTHLTRCVEALERFLSRPAEIDLAAEELRVAVDALGRVTGRIDVEDVLDVLFRDFCIGK